MKNENSVMAILAAAVGALCSYAAALVVPLAVLLAVMVGDYVSGMAKAWSTGKLCSKTGLRGILKKLGYLALVGVAGVVDWLVRYGLTQVGVEVSFRFLMAAMVIVWLIINELISILENVAALGGPVPGFLQKLLGRLKDTVEKKAETDLGNVRGLFYLPRGDRFVVVCESGAVMVFSEAFDQLDYFHVGSRVTCTL